MGSKNKLRRFRENETFSCLVQPDRDDVLSGSFGLRGQWGREFFKNDNPIVLELGVKPFAQRRFSSYADRVDR